MLMLTFFIVLSSERLIVLSCTFYTSVEYLSTSFSTPTPRSKGEKHKTAQLLEFPLSPPRYLFHGSLVNRFPFLCLGSGKAAAPLGALPCQKANTETLLTRDFRGIKYEAHREANLWKTLSRRSILARSCGDPDRQPEIVAGNNSRFSLDRESIRERTCGRVCTARHPKTSFAFW